jgi:hypothetical protein
MIRKVLSGIFRIRPQNLFGLGVLFLLWDADKWFWVGFPIIVGSVSWWIIVGSWQLTHHDNHTHGTSLKRIKEDIMASIHMDSNNRF